MGMVDAVFCETCGDWRAVLREATLCERMGLGEPQELPIDPPF